MPKVDVLQTAFVGGEFGPSLRGRRDLDQYREAAAIVQNFIVRPFGSLISTPGTEFINQCVTGGSTTLTGVRLIPFVFSETDSYVIEMGAGYFQFYTNGALVVSNSTAYQVAHNYAAPSISTIQYCQNNDVVYLLHENYPPMTLTRSGATSWALAAFPFTGGPFMPSNITATTINPSSASSGASTTLSASSNIFTPSSATTTGHNGTFWSIGALITSATTGLDVQGYVQINTVTNPSTAAATVIAALSGTGATSNWAEGSWSAVRGWPARPCFYQSRLFMARTDSEPQTVWGSGNFAFTNYAVNGGDDDDALNLQLSATEGNDIKWLLPTTDLIVGTYGGEFSISANGVNSGNPLTPSTVGVIQQTSWGSEAIIPKKIGNFNYYVQRYGQKLREITYEWLTANYQSADLTIFSPQMAGGAFVDIAYQQNPDTVLWCVCSNGTLATLTREVTQKVTSWSRQITLGNYISVATIPSQQGAYDEVWVIVQRTINGTTVNYVERFASQLLPVQADYVTPQQDQLWYVHSGAQYSAFETSASSSASISLSGTAGTITITSSTGYFALSDVGERIRAVDNYDNIQGEILITSYGSSTSVEGTSTVPFTSTSYSSGYWGVSVQQIGGLSYLEGQTVVVNADGGTDYPSKVVSAGTIDLSYNYFVVTAGLPATQTFMTLPPEAGGSRGTTLGKKQRISEIAFNLNQSYTGFYISGTTGTLYLANPRSPTTALGVPPPLLTGVLPNIAFSDDYRYGSQILIVNSDPFPMEILNIVSTVETFEK